MRPSADRPFSKLSHVTRIKGGRSEGETRVNTKVCWTMNFPCARMGQPFLQQFICGYLFLQGLMSLKLILVFQLTAQHSATYIGHGNETTARATTPLGTEPSPQPCIVGRYHPYQNSKSIVLLNLPHRSGRRSSFDSFVCFGITTCRKTTTTLLRLAPVVCAEHTECT